MRLIFYGGGTFFWWQAAAARQLNKMYSLDKVSIVGYSAGALASVLTICEVETSFAYEVANEVMQKERGIFSLAFGWGTMVEQWLDTILPPDAHLRCKGRLVVLITVFSPLPKVLEVTEFKTREELKSCLLSSTHIPFFMNGWIWRDVKCEAVNALGHTRAADPVLLEYLGLSKTSIIPPRGGDVCVDQTEDTLFMTECEKNGWNNLSPKGTDSFIRFGEKWSSRTMVPFIPRLSPSIEDRLQEKVSNETSFFQSSLIQKRKESNDGREQVDFCQIQLR